MRNEWQVVVYDIRGVQCDLSPSSAASTACAVGTRSQFILAWQQGLGPGSDNVFLSGLRRETRRYGRKGRWGILADADLDGRGALRET